MNKKIIAGMIVLMGISIVGIIIVQLVWMNNAIRVRNELFDRNVVEALSSTTNRLETLQDFRLVNHFAFDDSTGNFMIPAPPPPDLPNPPNVPKRITMKGKPHMRKIEMTFNSGKNGNSFMYHISSGKNNSEHGKDSVIVINPDSMAHKLNIYYAHGINKFDSLVGRLDFNSDSTGKLRQIVEDKTAKMRRVARRAVQEISTWEEDVPVERVTEVLKKELTDRNIPIPFELGILKNSSVSQKSNKADSALLVKSTYNVNLYPANIFQKNVRLAVYFPQKDTFIYKTINWLLLISLLFSVVVLASFATGVYFILKQKKISEMKSDFINNMTHEFKTPIATISVAADSIANQKVIENPDRIHYFVDMIKKENRRMNRQVEDILTIARLDKKEFDFRWETVNLHEIIENAIQSIVLQVEKKGGVISTELVAENPLATSDASHFANLIYNLLDNANKYSMNEPQIKISTRNTAKGVLISVSDKGIGMTKAVQSRIFERFYRQTSGNIHNVKGFGLGLSYVKAVLEANKGSISVHSEPEKGSTFDVFIPFVRD